MLTGLIVVLAITLVSNVARTYIGEPMDRLGYEWLIPVVVPSGGKLPAVAVDFKDRFRRADGSTDCAALDRLLASVIKLGPSAVVVDFDFGIDPNGRKNEGGEIVTARTWKDTKPPIYLASLSVGLPKDRWLNGGNPDYAVHPYIPSDARTGQVYLIGPLKIGSEPAMPGMMDTLAKFGPQHPPSWFMNAVATDQVERTINSAYAAGIPVTATQYLFNPATLDLVKADSVDASSRDLGSELRSKIAGRIAIIGSSTDPTDLHGRSDQVGQKVSGLYLVTAGVAAFSGERLYVFKPLVRIALDIASGLCIVGVVQWILRRSIHDKREVALGRIANIATVITSIAVVSLGLLLARLLNVLWMDFLLVAVVVALHPLIEQAIHAAKHRKKLSIDRILFKEEEASEP
ncbi:MAG: hypothetical protein ACYC96_02740 [Fimbriimonadaceae bacterium]